MSAFNRRFRDKYASATTGTAIRHYHGPWSRRAPNTDRREDSGNRHSNLDEDGVERRDGAPSNVGKDWDENINNSNSDVFSVRTTISNSRSVAPSFIPTLANTGPSTAQSPRNTIIANNVSYWSSLSVRVITAVIQARGSEEVAQKAASAVIEAGKNRGTPPASSLQTLASEVSVAVLRAGGGPDVAAAVSVAIMKNNGGDFYRRPTQEMAKRKTNKSVSFNAPPMAVERTRLGQKKEGIAQKKMALDEAERLSLRKERDILERQMELLELDASAADMLEKFTSMQDEVDRMIASKEIGEQNIDSLELFKDQLSCMCSVPRPE